MPSQTKERDLKLTTETATACECDSVFDEKKYANTIYYFFVLFSTLRLLLRKPDRAHQENRENMETHAETCGALAN